MDVRQLEVFLAVLECSSVTKAAERVNLSPGAVSWRLRQLASDLNTELFAQSGRHLIATSAALRLAELSKGVLHQIHQIEREFASGPMGDNRPFYFATGATTLVHQLGAPLRHLRQRFPNVQIEITVAGTEEMVTGLLNRRYDLALISLPVDGKHLNIQPLFEEEMLILKPSPARVGGWHVGSIQPGELASAPFLLYPKRSVMRTIIDKFFREVNVTPRVIMEADDAQALKRLVETGFGYSVLPEPALRGQRRFFRMFRLPGHRIVREQALATARAEHPRALTESIARFLQGHLTAKK